MAAAHEIARADSASPPRGPMAKRKPNVLLIVCDQLRADMLGAHGGAGCTPNLDALAAQSVVCDRAYCVQPVCVPVRMTLLTGLHPATCPLRIPPSVPTLPGVLADAGWHTAAIGKMHMVPPRGPYGFRELALAEDTGCGMFLDDYHPWLAQQGLYEWEHGLTNYDILPAVSSLPEEKTVTAWTGERVVEFLRSRRSSAEPFFLVASFVKPHPPYDPPQPWLDRVASLEVPKPLGLERPPESYPEAVRLRRAAYQESEAARLGLTETIRTHYMALTAQIDHEVGRILQAIDAQGMTDDTLILFCSDHGDFLGDHHLFMKFFPYESAARIPLLVRAPGHAAGRSQTPVTHLDVVPTILDFCGLTSPDGCQGEGILGLDREGHEARDGVVFSFGTGRGFCLVQDRFKYAWWPNGEEELFDLQADPQETRNLVREKTALTASLRGSLVNRVLRLDACRVGEAPPLAEGGELIRDVSYRAAYGELARRCLSHRVPMHLLGGPCAGICP